MLNCPLEAVINAVQDLGRVGIERIRHGYVVDVLLEPLLDEFEGEFPGILLRIDLVNLLVGKVLLLTYHDGVLHIKLLEGILHITNIISDDHRNVQIGGYGDRSDAELVPFLCGLYEQHTV